jgi:Zn-dependent oligopeptidase
MSGASDEACYAAAKDKIAAWQRDNSRIPLGRDSDGSAIIGMNLLSHSHFVAYGGDYFAYIFAKAKANEIWDLHFSNKPLRADKGKLMWKTMLAKGAGRPPVKILKDILSAQR